MQWKDISACNINIKGYIAFGPTYFQSPRMHWCNYGCTVHHVWMHLNGSAQNDTYGPFNIRRSLSVDFSRFWIGLQTTARTEEVVCMQWASLLWFLGLVWTHPFFIRFRPMGSEKWKGQSLLVWVTLAPHPSFSWSAYDRCSGDDRTASVALAQLHQWLFNRAAVSELQRKQPQHLIWMWK